MLNMGAQRRVITREMNSLLLANNLEENDVLALNDEVKGGLLNLQNKLIGKQYVLTCVTHLARRQRAQHRRAQRQVILILVFLVFLIIRVLCRFSGKDEFKRRPTIWVVKLIA